MTRIQHIEIPLAATRTVLYEGGAGRACVLLHGGGMDSARLSWGLVWERMADHVRVLAPDFPGYGDTSLGAVPPTLEGYRQWLAELLDALRLERVVLVGRSLGGGVALRLARDAPERVAGLVLCAPYGVSPRSPGGRCGYLLVRLPGVNALSWALMRSSDATTRWTLRTLLHRNSPTPELVAEVRKLAAKPHAARAWSSFQHDEMTWSGPRTYYHEQLATVRCPGTLLSGEHDGLVPPDDVRAAAELMPDGRFSSVTGAGHWLPRDAPNDVLESVLHAVH